MTRKNLMIRIRKASSRLSTTLRLQARYGDYSRSGHDYVLDALDEIDTLYQLGQELEEEFNRSLAECAAHVFPRRTKP